MIKSLLRTLLLFTLLIIICAFVDTAQRAFNTYPTYTFFMVIIGFIATLWHCLIKSIIN